ncbi:ABC transporter permease [Paenibacillus sp. R14(2021)]|uniref:ABC transporter permease n=1 Tax=Paenibacillus sp. R14(2021) TaxID=2859228 RepID=UPI001C613665|nr:ABC transporter permease [Paenibacillus sp. R14(2021)]
MLAYWEFLQERYADILHALGQHVTISLIAIILGTIVAVPIGIALVYNRIQWINGCVFFAANLLQTVPSLALLAVLIPLMGIGTKPAVVALLLYTIMPILRNTYDGFESVDRNVLESARGMGYGTLQRVLLIQLPLSLPYIMSGIRVTMVYIISWATLATLIGAGGLGQLIVSGMAVNKPELIITGALGSILLALIVDFVLGILEKWLTGRFGGAKRMTL